MSHILSIAKIMGGSSTCIMFGMLTIAGIYDEYDEFNIKAISNKHFSNVTFLELTCSVSYMGYVVMIS
jgi:hypothetical protein